jgi:Tol biopolymer transport system component
VNPGGQSFVWSGDGGSLVYANVYVLYRVAADASTDEVVLRAPSLIGPLALARDGVRLAYAVSPYTSTRGAGVWTVSLASGAPRQLTRSGQERVQFLSWAPAGDRVAFAQTNDVRIHLVAAATGIQTLLPREHPGTVFGGLEWSPDGERLLFATEFTDDTELYSLLFSGSAAGPLRRLTLNWAEDVDPAWSPDGRTLAFASNRSGNFDVYTMRSDGSGLRRLTRDPADDREPAWSPDGSRIVFSSNRLAGAAERKARKNGYEVAHLYVVRADGSHLRRLTTGVTAGDHTPAWSPDGRVIVFSSWVQDPPLLETVLANGSRRRSAGETGTAPDWSPDGKSIVYLHVYYPDGAAASASSPPPQEELALMTPSGSPTSSLGDHAAAHWSPDGKLLASADGSILDTGGVVRGTIPPGQSSWQSR